MKTFFLIVFIPAHADIFRSHKSHALVRLLLLPNIKSGSQAFAEQN